jgi:phage terminase large subunit
MKVTNVYTRNLEAFSKAKNNPLIIENRGGQGSGKTYSILQNIFTIVSESRKARKITIASYALPHLKAGAMSDFEKILILNNIIPSTVRVGVEYSIHNSKIEFVGIEGNESRVTGPRRDILYINELNNRIRYDVFDLMNSRTSEATFIDYNPRSQFWLQEKMNPNFPFIEIVSTFLDNPYLPERERQNILMKKNKPGFENWWKVYGLGEFGSFEDVIITNWKFGEFIPGRVVAYGLDFGVKDPDAMVKVSVDNRNKKIYCHELIYKSGLSTHDLSVLIDQKVRKNELIIADSSGLRTINDLKSKGFNIRPVSKNRILADIKTLMDYELIITPESFNLAKELQNWVWLDKKGEVPIDAFCHGIDSIRYICSVLINPSTKKGHKLL